MSLNYVDKGSSDRLDPLPNAPDLNTNRLAHGTTSISPRARGTQTAPRVVYKNDTVIVYDSTNERIVIGRLPDGTFGIAISKPGIDVSSAF